MLFRSGLPVAEAAAATPAIVAPVVEVAAAVGAAAAGMRWYCQATQNHCYPIAADSQRVDYRYRWIYGDH